MTRNDGNLGLVYISESFENSDVRNIRTNNSTNGVDLFYVTFDTNLQDFDVKNRNQRYYDGNNIWDCIQSERIQSLLKTGGWFGEFEHPQSDIDGQKLSPERIQNVPPEKRAFKIMKPYIDGNVLKATIQSAQGEIGEGFGKEILAGWQPQFSARAIASMIMKNGKPYVQVRKLITYDAPWFPSHAIAHQTSDAKVTVKNFTESVGSVLESAKEKINDVMIPLKEILLEVGHKDVNTQLIMESFDLDESCLYGFDSRREHVIIKDNDNMIYANINPETVKKVNDFYNSFM